MILGITSLGEERMPIWSRVSLWVVHIAGGIVGGAAMAAGAVLASTPFRTFLPYDVRLTICVGVLAGLVLVDVGFIPLRSKRRQVPATWLKRYGHKSGFFLYGVALGSGLATFVPYAVTYGVFAVTFWVLPLEVGLLAGALFGFGRSFTVGLGALKAEGVSQVLYRSRQARRIIPYGSGLLLILLLANLVASSFI